MHSSAPCFQTPSVKVVISRWEAELFEIRMLLKDLLGIFILWFYHDAIWQNDMNIHLVFSMITSKPTSFLPSDIAVAFFYGSVFMFLPNKSSAA
jgi:hypothetical protein